MISKNAKLISLVKNSQCLERYIIEYCAPTLAGIKTGGMFRIKFSSDVEMYTEIRKTRNILRSKNMSLMLLQNDGPNALIYVFREDKLEEDLKDPDIDCLLGDLGYSKGNLKMVLRQLKERGCKHRLSSRNRCFFRVSSQRCNRICRKQRQ